MANSIGSYTLKVTPEKLQSQAEQLYSEINRVRNCFANITNKINSTSNYWAGEASNSYRSDYKLDKESVDEMIKRLKEHVTDLNSIAAIYTKTENNLQEQISRSLPEDIIV